jgi:hypothetical protein
MNTPESNRDASNRLKQILKEAGFVSYRLADGVRGLALPGRAREWLLVVRLTDDWCYVRTYVCDLPQEAGLRARLLSWAMEENGRLTMVKFSVAEQTRLVFEIEDRAEHVVDGLALTNLARFLHSTAETAYPKIFRIVSGDETLAELETSMAAPESR